MSITDSKMKIETLAWITDDEAEFWTSTSPRKTKKTFHHFSASKDFSPNDLHYEKNNQLNSKIEDPLSLSYKRLIEKQATEVSENAQKISIYEKFQLEENSPEISASFLDRLFRSSSRPPVTRLDYIDDEIFTDIKESEIRAAINGNTDTDASSNVENKLMNNLKSFIDELNEEKDVIMGTIDEETLFNRRSQKAKSLSSSIKNDDILFNHTFF
ncbi:unnamed protein product [Rotaria sp. Silwood2]|nr:unnamed protein product [Rotaria sp. Silwood2]CAF4345689.1 unnamed protein product [Rotaria sp. Silwood2]